MGQLQRSGESKTQNKAETFLSHLSANRSCSFSGEDSLGRLHTRGWALKRGHGSGETARMGPGLQGRVGPCKARSGTLSSVGGSVY